MKEKIKILTGIKKIIKIHQVKDYKVTCLFNNGESRIIDFKHLFEKWKIKKSHIAYPLLEDINAFQKFEIIDGSFVWPNIQFESLDDEGNKMVQYFDLDPFVLYDYSEKDMSRSLSIGLKIKQARKELGLTQTQLAQKSSTSKHYISRVENEKSGIELMTLKKNCRRLRKTFANHDRLKNNKKNECYLLLLINNAHFLLFLKHIEVSSTIKTIPF